MRVIMLAAVLPLVSLSPWRPPASVGRPACFALALPVIDQAVSREDSLALAERFEREPPGGDAACGRMVSGYLIGMTSTPAEDHWRERQKGAALLENALRYASDEPRIFMAMGILLYHRQARTDALRSLDRALDRRDKGEVALRPHEVAAIHYMRGLMQQDFWRDWRSYGQLKATSGGQWHCGRYETPGQDNFTSTSEDYTWLIGLNQLCPEVFGTNMTTFFEPRADMNRNVFDDEEAAFRQAVASDSSFLPAYEALLGEYAYLEMWDRAEPVARAFHDRNPEDYRGYLYLATVLHETGRDSAAAPLYAKAFLYTPDSVTAVLEDISLLLLPGQQEWYAGADDATRRSALTAFWNSIDPLYLTPLNERKLEHYARVTEAKLMFGSHALRTPGWSSYAGRMWIRYGRPVHMWELKIPTGRVVFWDLGPGPDLSFTRGAAYESYRPSDEAIQYANALEQVSPQTYDASSLVDSLAPLSRQIARMLGPDGRSQIMVYTVWPPDAQDGAIAGLTLLDRQFLPAAQWRGGKPDEPGIRAVLNGVPRGLYSLTVEVWDRGARRLSRARDTVSTLAIEDSSFVVSDVILASGIRSLAGEDASSRRDVRIDPLYGAELSADESLGLYWEIYRLKGEGTGRVQYRVRIQVLDASRQPMLARVLEGVGIGGGREAATEIEYESNRPLVNGRAVEWLQMTGQLAPGDYRVVVTFVDAETGREVTRERAVTVR